VGIIKRLFQELKELQYRKIDKEADALLEACSANSNDYLQDYYIQKGQEKGLEVSLYALPEYYSALHMEVYYYALNVAWRMKNWKKG